MILEALLIGTAIVLLGVTVDSIILRIRRRALLRSIAQLTFENLAMEDELSKIPSIPSETEGFIRFLSESREWAFTYIEDVQSALEDLRNALDTKNDEEINLAYQKLITFLPEKMNND